MPNRPEAYTPARFVSRRCQGSVAVAPHFGLSLDGVAVRRDGAVNRILDGLLAAMFAAGVAAACGAAPARATEQQQPSYACVGGEIGRGTVSRIADGRTFILEDGREVHLAAIEVPPAPPTQHASYAPDGNATAAALTALAGGDQVILRSAEIASDRYGRLVAYVYTMRDGDEFSCRESLSRTALPASATGSGTIALGNF